MREQPKQPIRELSWDNIDDLMYTLANNMIHQIPDLKNKFLVPICRGGLVPCGILSYHLALAVKGAIRVTSYIPVKGIVNITEDTYYSPVLHKDMIFVDDIVDTGDTFIALAQHYPAARYVCPVGKPKGVNAANHILAVQPILNVPDVEWVSFPWDRNQPITKA